MAREKASPLAVADLDAADRERWEELALDAADPNPFFEPGIVLAAERALPSAGLGVLVTRDGPQWTSCTPVMRRRNWRGTPMRGTIGWAHIYSFLGTPLVRAGATAIHAEAILTATVATRGSAFLALPQLSTLDQVGAALTAASQVAGVSRTMLQPHERAFLHRRDDPESYVQLSAKRRREFRRQFGKLAELLDAELEVCDESDTETGIDDFLRIEASGWKGRNGTAFASIGHSDFFREICAYFRERGRLQLLVLRAAGRPLAVKCNFRSGDGLFCFKIGFDEELSRFSPGVQLELATIARFHADPELNWMDSCAAPTNEMINRLWPDRRTIETVAYTDGVRGAATRRSLLAAERARAMRRRRALAAAAGRQARVERAEPGPDV